MSTPVEDAPLPEPPLPETPYESPRKLAVIFFFLFLLLTSPVLLSLADSATPEADAPLHTQPDVTKPPSLRPDSFGRVFIIGFFALTLTGLIMSTASVLHFFRASPKLAFIRFLSANWRPMPCLRLLDGLSAFFLFIAANIVVLIVFSLIGFKKINTQLSPGQFILVAAFVNIFLFAVPTIFLILRARTMGGPDGGAGFWPFWKSPGQELSSTLWPDIKLGIKGYVYTNWFLLALALLNNVVVGLVSGRQPTQNPVIDELRNNSSGPESTLILPVLFFAITFSAPFIEELLFRGGMYNTLIQTFGRIGSAVITSTIFALAHHVPSNTWPLFFMSISFIWLYEKTGRLVAPMVMHATNNLVVTVLTVVGGTDFQG